MGRTGKESAVRPFSRMCVSALSSSIANTAALLPLSHAIVKHSYANVKKILLSIAAPEIRGVGEVFLV